MVIEEPLIALLGNPEVSHRGSCCKRGTAYSILLMKNSNRSPFSPLGLLEQITTERVACK